MPARGRGGVQVLERLGPESAQNLYSPAPPGPCRGLQNLCCFCMAGRNPTRSLLHRRNNQYAGLRVPARGRGGVQVLERLGPESAQNLYSPAPPGRGLQNLCCLCMAGRNPTRSLLLRRNNQYAGLRVPARDAGEYRFWNVWGLKVPKTCTPTRPPGHAGDYRTCAVFVWRAGTLHVRYFIGETINTWACGCRPGDAGEYRFWNAWGLKVPKTCTPPRPPDHAGDYRTCAVFVRREGTLHVRYFIGETINTRACGCRPGDAGEYRFWSAWGLKVPKTCTPTRPPGHAGDYRTCAVFVWREGTLHVRYFLGETINKRACGCRPGDAGEYRFWSAWGLNVPKTCTPTRPPGHAGDHRTCAVLYGGEGTLHVRYFLGEAINKRACGCRPGDAGEYRFWNAWGLKVPKTCTPPRPPTHAGDYRTCAVFVWREGTLHVRCLH